MTETSRRTLLRAGVLGVVLAPLVPSWLEPASAAPSLYAKTRFARLRRGRFTLVDGHRSVRLRLVKVRGTEKQFDLTFRAARTGPAQGTYRLTRGGFTSTSLFLVPDARRRTYQATINRA